MKLDIKDEMFLLDDISQIESLACSVQKLINYATDNDIEIKDLFGSLIKKRLFKMDELITKTTIALFPDSMRNDEPPF